MDWKSIVLKQRMKFFFSITLKSSCPFLNWAYLYDAQDTLEPFRLLTFQYSMRHNLQPKNDVPNIACSTLEIPSVEVEKNVLLISLPKYLHSMKVGTQHAYEYGLCLQHLLEFEHFQNYISVSTNLGNDVEYRLAKQNNDISSPILNGNSNYLLNANSCGSLTYNKTKTFIETKVTAIKLQGFNL